MEVGSFIHNVGLFQHKSQPFFYLILRQPEKTPIRFAHPTADVCADPLSVSLMGGIPIIVYVERAAVDHAQVVDPNHALLEAVDRIRKLFQFVNQLESPVVIPEMFRRDAWVPERPREHVVLPRG